MKSTLIKDTTVQERIEIIRGCMGADDSCDGCDIDLMDMYSDYISGKKEIAQINAEFTAKYMMG